eukprot:gene13655-13778_t
MQQSGGTGYGTSSSKELAQSCAVRTWIVMEYCGIGDLCTVLRNLRAVLGPASEEFRMNLLDLLRGAAEGVSHLHLRHIVHGDLNVRNVLVTIQDGPNPQAVAKVSDFGLSRTLNMTHRTTTTQGTITHMSPERLATGRNSPAADVFAFGVMMWEAWTGDAAFKGLHFGQVCHAVVTENARPEIPGDMPTDYRQLMERCWAREPYQRPTMAQVLETLQQLLASTCDGSEDLPLGTAAAASGMEEGLHATAQQQQEQQQQVLGECLRAGQAVVTSSIGPANDGSTVAGSAGFFCIQSSSGYLATAWGVNLDFKSDAMDYLTISVNSSPHAYTLAFLARNAARKPQNDT